MKLPKALLFHKEYYKPIYVCSISTLKNCLLFSVIIEFLNLSAFYGPPTLYMTENQQNVMLYGLFQSYKAYFPLHDIFIVGVDKTRKNKFL